MDTTISVWRDLEEELVRNVDRTCSAGWASVKHGGSVRGTIVVDVDCLAAVRVEIRVDAVRHVGGVNGDEVLRVGARNTAGAETYGHIIVGHVSCKIAGSGAGTGGG